MRLRVDGCVSISASENAQPPSRTPGRRPCPEKSALKGGQARFPRGKQASAACPTLRWCLLLLFPLILISAFLCLLPATFIHVRANLEVGVGSQRRPSPFNSPLVGFVCTRLGGASCTLKRQMTRMMVYGIIAGSPVPHNFLEDTPDPLFVGCYVDVKVDPTSQWHRARSVVLLLRAPKRRWKPSRSGLAACCLMSLMRLLVS